MLNVARKVVCVADLWKNESEIESGQNSFVCV